MKRVVDEFQRISEGLSGNIKTNEMNIRDQISEIEGMVMNVKDTMTGLQQRLGSPKTNSHMFQEIGQLKDDLR